MNKIGRNDLCLCGSEKKYKKCCIDQDTNPFLSQDKDWYKIRIIENEIIDNHLSHYMEKIPKSVYESALALIFSSRFSK